MTIGSAGPAWMKNVNSQLNFATVRVGVFATPDAGAGVAATFAGAQAMTARAPVDMRAPADSRARRLVMRVYDMAPTSLIAPRVPVSHCESPCSDAGLWHRPVGASRAHGAGP